MTSKVSKKLLLNGIFGLFKEKGYTIDDYKTWIRLSHWNDNNLGPYKSKWSSPSIILDIKPKYMEPLATGTLCVGIGTWATRLTHLTQFWEHEWIVSAKLGTHTENYCSDSPVVYMRPFDHINEELLNQSLKQFVGPIEQTTPPHIWKEPILIPKPKEKERTKSVWQSKEVYRVRNCHSIEVISFEPPYLKLKVISDGQFSCRSLINDLGSKLESCGHLTELHLNRMGVITPKDCLKKYEIHSNLISEAIGKYSKLCSKDLSNFKELKPFNKRVI